MSSVDFLADNNACGQTILKLVSRGNAILAELLRLSDNIPPLFSHPGCTDTRDPLHFIIPDFVYFNKPDYYDQGILNNPDVEELDDDFKQNHLEIIVRFYKMFESIYKYVMDLNRFHSDLDEGVFIQQTVEMVLFNADGKQLISEAVFLYGAMLLILDMKIEGKIRERIMVAYHRHASATASSMDANIEDVCKLLRSTDYQHLPTPKYPPNYPDVYLSRVPVDREFIRMLIGRLRSDDIYNQITSYPNPEHRSVALATQAAMLYVILFFAPDILHTQQSQMREIVDKHFPDNWVISLYMGITVNLIEAWEPYKAARMALDNILQMDNVKSLAVRHIQAVPRLDKKVLSELKEGTLTEDYLLDHIPRLMNLIRDCNVTIRWLMLHTPPTADHCKLARQIRNAVIPNFSGDQVFNLLLNTSQLEFLVKEMFQKLMAEKQEKWEAYKKEGVERMVELADVFSGTKPLTRVEKNEHLQAWFREMSTQIESLSYEDFTSAGRKIMQLNQALEEVLEFHGLENNMQVKQFLADTRQYLHNMFRTINIREEILITLQLAADLSYAWLLIESYTPYMQKGIQVDPYLVIKLRATFLQLSSGMELPLFRISQAKSKDLKSVSAYYSQQLVAYVRRVLQIIPRNMFKILGEIINILTSKMMEVPIKLDKEKMKELSQLELREKVSRLTNKISIFTEGMLLMKTTLVGVIKVDPKRMLEDGIRKELVVQVTKCLHEGLIFNPRAKTSELQPRLKALASRMGGFRKSFEYIQDYVSIYGLKIWQEEVSRIINYCVEQECNSFLRTRVEDWQSMYQSKAIPIPKFAPIGDGSVTFVGRLANEVQRITDARTTVYVDATTAWYDFKTGEELVNLNLWVQLQEAVDIFGLAALDRLFCFKIVRELQRFLKTLKTWQGKNPDSKTPFKQALLEFTNSVVSTQILVENAPKVYSRSVGQLSKFLNAFLPVVLIVGQLQLIRRQICRELGSACKYDSKLLRSTLEAFNESLLSEVRTHYRDPSKPFPGGEDSTLLYDLTPYLESTGISDPVTKIYVTFPSICSNGIAQVVFLFVISQLPKLAYDKKSDSLLRRRPADTIDGAPFVVGVLTLLRQFHSDNTELWLALMGQYVRSMVESVTGNPKEKSLALPMEVVNTLLLLEEFARYAHLPRKVCCPFQR
jgi:WASH complex subunit strumpellin